MNDWTDKGMASSWTASAVGPAPHRRSLDWTEGLVRESYADASNPRSGRSDVEISCRQAQAVEACASTSSVNSSEGFFQL